MSGFHVVLNLNISHYDLSNWDRDKRLKMINIVKSTLIHIKNNLEDFTLDRIRQTPEEFIFHFEVGKMKKFIHVDGFIKLGKKDKLSFGKITELFNRHLADYTKGVYLNVKFVPDTIATVKNYSSKDGNRIV